MLLLHPSASADASALAVRLLDDQCARLIVGSRLAIHWRNAAATALLAAGRGIVQQHDQLQFHHLDHELRFTRFLHMMGEVGAFAMPRSDPDGWLLFNCRRLRDDRSDYVALVVTSDDTGRPARYHDFETIFRLTGAENRIVTAMLDGHMADEIAVRFGLSVMTVRTHLRRIYQKLDVSSREQLLHRLNQYRCD